MKKHKTHFFAAACMLGMAVITLQTPVSATSNQDLTNDNKTDSSPIEVVTELIPAPSYSVTIPEIVTFGKVLKTKTDHIEKRDFTVTVQGVSNLYENQKKLKLDVTSTNGYQISDGAATPNYIGYTLYSTYTDETSNTPITDGKVMEISGAANADTNLDETINGAITMNAKNIKRAGTYTDTLNFTVSLVDME